mmetsp:Transcript_123727/g.283681  ORF Transcript_123727/g.283681 Transcript_123727/m.283681 type:complete len:444 (-) Transcript_123727:72-1403(-)
MFCKVLGVAVCLVAPEWDILALLLPVAADSRVLLRLVVADLHSAASAEIPALHQTILTNLGVSLFFNESHIISTSAALVPTINWAVLAILHVIWPVLGHGFLEALLELTRHRSELADLGLVGLQIPSEGSVGAALLMIPAGGDLLAVLPALLLVGLQLPVDLGLPTIWAWLLAKITQPVVLSLVPGCHTLVTASMGVAAASDAEGAGIPVLLEVAERLPLGAPLIGTIHNTPLTSRFVLLRILSLEILLAALESAHVLGVSAGLLMLGDDGDPSNLCAPRVLEGARELAERAGRLVLQRIPQWELLLAPLVGIFTLYRPPVALLLVLLLVLHEDGLAALPAAGDGAVDALRRVLLQDPSVRALPTPHLLPGAVDQAKLTPVLVLLLVHRPALARAPPDLVLARYQLRSRGAGQPQPHLPVHPLCSDPVLPLPLGPPSLTSFLH